MEQLAALLINQMLVNRDFTHFRIFEDDHTYIKSA